MKRINELNFGYGDAENYLKPSNKTLFNKIFVKNELLDRLLSTDISFLVGEKGTGKTAYSVFLSNNLYKETKSSLNYIRETSYQKFVILKQKNHLDLSDYCSIWKVVLLLQLCLNIDSNELDHNKFSKTGKIKAINSAINEFYLSAFSPEIINILQFIENSKISAELISKYLKAGGEESITTSFSESRFQVNLMYLEKQFKDALKGVKLKLNHIIFIDGIDVRPGTIPYSEYLECIKGLANAIWELNNDFFPKIKDTHGRCRAVLLIRPDIFNSLSLQNSTNKLIDNSVFLDWRTTYPAYKSSSLYNVFEQLLKSQQDDIDDSLEYWNFYLPWKRTSTNEKREFDDSFIDFLRLSYSRPRDIITMLSIMKEHHIINCRTTECFQKDDFDSYEFQNKYSNYLMGGIKDQLSFYYTSEDYETFLHFFNFLNGNSEFTYNEYETAYQQFTDFILKERNDIPEFVEDKNKFLQFLFDSNILYYIEEVGFETLFRFCYRERSISNITPKVKYNVRYRIHYGLKKELNLK